MRLLNELGLVSKIPARVSVKTAFVLAHDSTPLARIDDLDTQLQAGVPVAS